MNRYYNLYEDGKCIYTNLNYPPFSKIEDIEEQKSNYLNVKKKLLSNLNQCDKFNYSIFSNHKKEKHVSFIRSKISDYPNIDSLSEKDIDNKILDLIKNKFDSERQGEFNFFCKFISMPYGYYEYDNLVFNEFIKDPSFNNMSRIKELIVNDIKNKLNKIIPDELKICLNDYMFLITYASPLDNFGLWNFLEIMEILYIEDDLNIKLNNPCSKCFDLKVYCETREKVKDLIPKYKNEYGIRGLFNKCISFFFNNNNNNKGYNKTKND